ncbi:MAG: hypothetical protein O3C27_07575 [Actinomycetota bacterium]|nr:hypothetical protein [Actinomycetota bacterium]
MFVVAVADDVDEARAASSGSIDDYVERPIRLADLATTLRWSPGEPVESPPIGRGPAQ